MLSQFVTPWTEAYGIGSALGVGLVEGLAGGTSCPYPDRVFLNLLGGRMAEWLRPASL